MNNKETIEVNHWVGDKNDNDIDSKQFGYNYGGYMVTAHVPGDTHFYQGVFINIEHDSCEPGVEIRIKQDKGKLYISMDTSGGMIETKSRTVDEWLELENISTALKIIGKSLR